MTHYTNYGSNGCDVDEVARSDKFNKIIFPDSALPLSSSQHFSTFLALLLLYCFDLLTPLSSVVLHDKLTVHYLPCTTKQQTLKVTDWLGSSEALSSCREMFSRRVH